MMGSRSRHRAGRRPQPLCLRLEVLEGRVVPATLTVLNAADTGPGSLRAAIAQAQSGDTIDFAAQLDGQTITLTSGELAIGKSIDIEGPGAGRLSVSGGGTSRVFDITASHAMVTIAGLTIAHGQAPDLGGGISNAGTLMVIGSTISGNTAGGFDSNNTSGGRGGGIANSGTLTITDSTLSGNTAGGGGDNIPGPPAPDGGGVGGGIANSGTLTITDSTLSGNTAGGGGHGYLDFGISLELLPGVGGVGGGIANSGSLTVTDSTLSGNTADSSAPGYIVEGLPTFHRTVLPGNGGVGGGIANSGSLTVTDSTLSSNAAGGGSGGGGGGIALLESASDASYTGVKRIGNVVTMATNSIFQNAVGGNIYVSSGMNTHISAAGTFRSLGHNLFSDDPASGDSFVVLDPTDLINTDPLLGPLADNGGPTQTQALLPGSPAIDAGVAVPGLTTDQRGISRPQGANPDIGAFESRGFTLTLTGGNHQSTAAGAAFPAPLTFALASPYGEPIAGGRVSFRAPAAGASASLSSTSVTLNASGNGRVTATANSVVDSYTVSAHAAGANSIAWSLKNTVPIPPVVVGLVHSGIHWQPTRIVLTFNQPMDPTSVQSARNYVVLAGAGRNLRVISVASAVYSAATRSVTLTTARHLDIHYTYTLFVNAASHTGVRSAAGVPLDGAGTGHEGTNYVKRFGRESLVLPTVSVPRPQPLRLR